MLPCDTVKASVQLTHEDAASQSLTLYGFVLSKQGQR